MKKDAREKQASKTGLRDSDKNHFQHPVDPEEMADAILQKGLSEGETIQGRELRTYVYSDMEYCGNTEYWRRKDA